MPGLSQQVYSLREKSEHPMQMRIVHAVAFGDGESFPEELVAVGGGHFQKVIGRGAGDGRAEAVDFLVGLRRVEINRAGRHIVFRREAQGRGGKILAAVGCGGQHLYFTVDPYGLRLGDLVFKLVVIVAGGPHQRQAADHRADYQVSGIISGFHFLLYEYQGEGSSPRGEGRFLAGD